MSKKLTPRKMKPTRMTMEFPADMKFEVKFTANFNTSLSECVKEKLTYLLNHELDTKQFTESTRAYLADLLGCNDVKHNLNLVFFSGDTENTQPVPTPDQLKD